MASKVTTLYEDSAKTNALYPRTKVSAVSDNNGNALEALLNAKQNQLVSGTNIKTVNGNSLLGAGDMAVGFVGIDTSNLLATIPSGYNISYTATQDCYMFWTQSYYSSGRELTLNGVALATENINVVLPLQAGDVITCGYNGKTVKVFGLK